MNAIDAESVIATCGQNGRVCPKPMIWNGLWELLPSRRRVGAGWEPPLPLILGAWHYTSNLEKIFRFQEQIRWAEQHGALQEVAAFLGGLAETDWHHLRD